MVWLNGQGLEWDIIGQLVKRNMEKYVYRPLSEWEKNMNMFVSHVNGHQRLTSAEEDFNNQVDKMTSLVDTSQLLSLATPVIAQRAHEQRAIVAGVEVICGLSNMEFQG